MPRSTDPKPHSLTAERIVAAALALVQRDGVDAFSMRRLAQELDVWPMALYRHFRDKDELLAAIADAEGANIELPTAEGPWRERMGELLLQVRRIFERHPGGLRIGLADEAPTPVALRISEAGLAILTQAGFEPDEAVSAWQALLTYTAGFPGLRSHKTGARATRRALVALASVGDQYPTLASMAPGIAGAVERDDFDYGLARLLDGLEARIPVNEATA